VGLQQQQVQAVTSLDQAVDQLGQAGNQHQRFLLTSGSIIV
jgi:hypothetical protein